MKSSEFEILKKSLAWFSGDQKKLLQKKSEFEFFDGIVGCDSHDLDIVKKILLSPLSLKFY